MDQKKMTPAKQKIISALEELLNYKDLDDIYISDIVRSANISRKTFYRHYQDKYDLVNAYFFEFFQNTFERITYGDEWDEALLRYLAICEEKALILSHAYSSRDANSLRKFDIEMTEKTYSKYLEMKGADVHSDEMGFAIRIASCGGTEMIIDWLLSGMKKDKRVLVGLIKRTLPQDVLKYLS